MNLLCHRLKPLYPWGPVASMRSWIVRGSFGVPPASALDRFVIPAFVSHHLLSGLVHLLHTCSRIKKKKIKRIIITFGAYFCLFETGFCCVALAGLEFIM